MTIIPKKLSNGKTIDLADKYDTNIASQCQNNKEPVAKMLKIKDFE